MGIPAQEEFSRLLAAKVYPALLSDDGYCEFLFGAGIFGELPASTARSAGAQAEYVRRIAQSARNWEALSPRNQTNLAKQAEARTHLVFGELASREAVRMKAANARLIPAPLRIYRGWDSRCPATSFGPFWFEKKLLDQCLQEAGPSQQDRFAWLRNACAVCFDWSDFDRLAELCLKAGEEIPVVAAIGLPKRAYSLPNRFTKPEDLPWNKVADLRDYWRRIGTTLAGGYNQLFLPFLPKHRISILKGI